MIRGRRPASIVLALLTLTGIAHADDRRAMPRWFAFGETSVYATGLDAGMQRDGAPALRLEAVRPPSHPQSAFGPPSGFASWLLDATRFRGKRVRMRGALKTAGAGSAALTIQAYRVRPAGSAARDGADRAEAPALRGDNDWTPVQTELDVAGDALQLEFGAKLEGAGTLWTTYPRVEAIGPAAARSLAAARLPGALDGARRAAVERALRRDAVPLRGVDPAAPLDDLAQFDRDVAHARIVGLGQATDGSVEAFRMKQRLFRDLVERHGVTVLVFEAGLVEARALDRYVAGRERDPVRALQGLGYWTWQHREIVDLLAWMRAYNAAPGTHATLHAAGYEVPFGGLAMRSVERFAAAHGKAAADAVTAGYACIPRDSDQYYAFFAGQRDARPACIAKVAAVARAIAPLHPDADTAHDARVVEQFVQNQLDPRGNGFGADDRLLENIVWLAQTRYRGAKLALWAHNDVLEPAPRTHWGEPLGTQLHRRFGSSFVRIGSECTTARSPAPRSTPSGPSRSAPRSPTRWKPCSTAPVRACTFRCGRSRRAIRSRPGSTGPRSAASSAG